MTRSEQSQQDKPDLTLSCAKRAGGGTSISGALAQRPAGVKSGADAGAALPPSLIPENHRGGDLEFFSLKP
jgi:hypothetical protein